MKFGLEVLIGIKLCLFDLNVSIKPVKKVFVYKYKLSLSLALLYLAEKKNSQLLLKKFLARAKQMPSRFYQLSARKSDDRGRSVIAHQNCNRWQQ